jgi:hypothetical protein
MKQGLNRFTFYLRQISELMEKAGNEKDPAMWLFRNSARTPFFMLEALARLYGGLHDRKQFDKLSSRFKLIEDELGKIDYYNSLAVILASNKKIPEFCMDYLKGKMEESAVGLNNILINEGWMTDNNKRIRKITRKLEKTGWLKPEKEVEKIAEFYKDEIGSITDFVSGSKYLFDNVEEDVHELRRRLRWLSIYPQSMQGVFQFDASSPAPPFIDKYMTPEITESPFNKLPPPGTNTSFVILNKKYFFALSWMIAKLGVLKDEGLLITGLAGAIKENSQCTDEDAIKEAYALSGENQGRLQQILDEAESLTKTFFREKNLKRLLLRTEKAGKKILKNSKKPARKPIKEQ